MEQENYELTKEYFFKSYKAFIDLIMFTHDEYSMYSILIIKKNLHRNLSKVN